MENFPSTSVIAPSSVFSMSTVAPTSAVCAFLSRTTPEILPFCAEAIEQAMNAMKMRRERNMIFLSLISKQRKYNIVYPRTNNQPMPFPIPTKRYPSGPSFCF